MSDDGEARSRTDSQTAGTHSAGTDPAGTEVSGSEPVEATRTFVDSVIWGDHEAVWELLSAEGRKTVLEVAVSHGMEEDAAARLGDGTASTAERAKFLVDLVYGLRNDLQGNDVDALDYELDPESPGPSRARVTLSARVPAELGGGLPVGSAELSNTGEGWRVERLVPRRSLSA